MQNPNQIMKDYEAFFDKTFALQLGAKTIEEFVKHSDEIKEWVRHELLYGVLHGEHFAEYERARLDYLKTCYSKAEAALSLEGVVLMNKVIHATDKECKGLDEKIFGIIEGMSQHFEALKQSAEEIYNLQEDARTKTQKAKEWRMNFPVDEIKQFDPKLPFAPPVYYQSILRKADNKNSAPRVVLEALLAKFMSGQPWTEPSFAPIREDFKK